MKRYKISIVTLLAALLLFVLSAVIVLSPTAAYAADRYVTVNGTNIFYTSIRGAEVTSAEETSDGETHTYTMFRIGEEQTVTYRKNLAYSWKSASEEGEEGVYQTRNFSMTIGFANTAFESYVIRFQSQQYVATEDKITENYLIFKPAEGGVSVYHSQDADWAEDKDLAAIATFSVSDNSRIAIKFASFADGNYTVSLSCGDVSVNTTFENVYESYAKYVSSGDNAVTPLTFSAQFAEDAQPAEGEDSVSACMKLYELNGQSFELYDNDSDGTYDQVIDNQPPVMCFSTTPAYVEYGTSYSFDFVLIDVLASSPRSTSYFYVLSGDQYSDSEFDYDATEFGEEEESPYTKVSSGSSIRVIRDDGTFVPSEYINDEDGNRVYGLVKIYYEISDVSGSTAQTDKVFIDWYAKQDALVNVADLKGTQSDGSENFLKLIDGKQGVTYATESETTLEAYKDRITAIEEDYQKKIDDAIAALEDGKLYAGSDNYFYLPAFEYASDDYVYPTDLKYSIYYKAETSGSHTSLASNNLSIALTQPDVTYRFTIFVTDEFSSDMRYPDGVDEDGNIIWKTIAAGDIWEEENAELLPFFEFEVSYKPATSEDPDDLSIAYVGSSYGGVSFDINGVDGTYTTSYRLYVFNRNEMNDELGLNLTYDEFVNNISALLNNTYKEGVNTRKYFTTVKPVAELNENDANYETMSAYNWSTSSTSFVPQSVDDFYVIELTLTDNRSQVSTLNYATVVASVETTALKGESDWLENNVASVILLSIAGVCLIALIVLLIVKPKDKGDIDMVLDAEDKKKSAKKSKK